jgi:hypothetical protein
MHDFTRWSAVYQQTLRRTDRAIKAAERGVSEVAKPLLTFCRPMVPHTSHFPNFTLPKRQCMVAPVGRLAQRLAHLLYTQVVGGSNPSSPTIFVSGKRLTHVVYACDMPNNRLWTLNGPFGYAYERLPPACWMLGGRLRYAYLMLSGCLMDSCVKLINLNNTAPQVLTKSGYA